MLEQVAAALDRGEYDIAAEIIATLLAEQPDNYQVQLYAARLQEQTEQFDRAIKSYQQLLQQGINSKAIAEARQGIARIQAREEVARQKTLQQAKAKAEARPEPGVLVLEPIPVEQKTAAAQKFGRIMNIDLYSARLQLPSRGWRLYRSGKIGELEMFWQQLQAAEIPSFCATLADIKSVVVFRVKYMQLFDREVKIFCTDDRAEQWSFRFKWSEITQIVTGLLPIFEEVVEIDARNRTKRKSKILDYVDVCDLQIGNRRTIFRLCSQTYEFREHQQLAMANSEMVTGDLSNYLNRSEHSGMLTGDLSGYLTHNPNSGLLIEDLQSGMLTGDLSTGLLNKSSIPYTSHNNWQSLISHIKRETCQASTQSQFTTFGDTALGYPELLQHIHPHIELLRRADSNWDRAFQLYSALVMCRYEQLDRVPTQPETSDREETDGKKLEKRTITSQDFDTPDSGTEQYN
jgi:hypothetical protein